MLAIAGALTTAHAADWGLVGTRVNGQPGPELMVLQDAAGQTFIRQDDLPALRLQIQPPVVRHDDGQAWISLSEIPGLTLSLDTTQQVLDILAPPSLLPLTRIDRGGRGLEGERLGQTSAFFNWGLEASGPSSSLQLRLSHEFGLRLGSFLVQTHGVTRPTPAGDRYVRLTTSAWYDRAQRQQRGVLGDFFLQGPELAGGANLGGVSLARVFALDPNPTRRSTPQLQGQLLYPSQVEVYVDGRAVRREQLPAGSFSIDDLYLPEGGRAIQLVTRDPYGRVQTTDYSFYASESLLAAGTSEFQYAAGALRRGYGLRNADYGPWALSAFHRVGLTPQLTVGGVLQARHGLLQVAAQGVMPLAIGPGLWAWNLGASRTDQGRGFAAATRYSVQRPTGGLGLFWRFDGPAYAMLSDPLVSSPGRSNAGVSGYWRAGPWGSLSLSHARQTYTVLPVPPLLASEPVRRHSESTSLAWSRGLGGVGNWLRLELTRSQRQGVASHRMMLAMGLALDRRTRLNLSGRVDPVSQSASGTLTLTRPAWPGESWGWDLGLDRTSSTLQGWNLYRGAGEARTRTLQLRGDWAQAQGQDLPTLRLTAGGGLAVIDGQAYWSRPIGDGYALVRVGTLADVPVTVNGVTVGLTDRRGELLVSDLSAYYDNQVGVDSSNIPIDYALDRISRRVFLPSRTGAVVDFKVTRIRALEGQLVRPPRGEPVGQALLKLQILGHTLESVTDAQGQIYLDQLPAGRHTGTAVVDGQSCRFAVDMPDNDEVVVSVGPIPCE